MSTNTTRPVTVTEGTKVAGTSRRPVPAGGAPELPNIDSTIKVTAETSRFYTYRGTVTGHAGPGSVEVTLDREPSPVTFLLTELEVLVAVEPTVPAAHAIAEAMLAGGTWRRRIDNTDSISLAAAELGEPNKAVAYIIRATGNVTIATWKDSSDHSYTELEAADALAIFLGRRSA